MAEQTVELYTGSATGTQIDNAAAKVAAMEETLSGTAGTIPSSAAVKNYVDGKAVETESTLLGNAVYDISEANNGTTYANLAAALNNGNNIPASIRKGGISIKFIQSSDNKYVQYRLTAISFSTTVTDWQGVDDVVNVGSANLPTSNAVLLGIKDNSALYVCDTASATREKTITVPNYILGSTGALRIKFTHKNTFATYGYSIQTAQLNINSTGAKPLYYMGMESAIGNSWDDGEVVDVYYDENANSGNGAYFAYPTNEKRNVVIISNFWYQSIGENITSFISKYVYMYDTQKLYFVYSGYNVANVNLKEVTLHEDVIYIYRGEKYHYNGTGLEKDEELFDEIDGIGDFVSGCTLGTNGVLVRINNPNARVSFPFKVDTNTRIYCQAYGLKVVGYTDDQFSNPVLLSDTWGPSSSILSTFDRMIPEGVNYVVFESLDTITTCKIYNDIVHKLDIIDVDILHPLSEDYYTFTTAIAFLPLAYAKKGRKIKFQVADGVWEEYTYMLDSATSADWTNIRNWKKKDDEEYENKGYISTPNKIIIIDNKGYQTPPSYPLNDIVRKNYTADTDFYIESVVKFVSNGTIIVDWLGLKNICYVRTLRGGFEIHYRNGNPNFGQGITIRMDNLYHHLMIVKYHEDVIEDEETVRKHYLTFYIDGVKKGNSADVTSLTGIGVPEKSTRFNAGYDLGNLLYRIGMPSLVESDIAGLVAKHFNNGNPLSYVCDDNDIIAEILGYNMHADYLVNSANGLSLAVSDVTVVKESPYDSPLTGEGAPTSVPRYVGQKYLDTLTNNSYIAKGTTLPSDWHQEATMTEVNALKTQTKTVNGQSIWGSGDIEGGGSGGSSSVVSVVDNGAVGDGITDDTVAIQTALEKARINGKALYFPRGTYMTKKSLILTSNMRITAEPGAILRNGTKKAAGDVDFFTRTTAQAAVGTTQVTVSDASGFEVGQEVVIWNSGSYTETMADITAISGNTLTIDTSRFTSDGTNGGIRNAIPTNGYVLSDFALIKTISTKNAENIVVENITLDAKSDMAEPHIYTSSPISQTSQGGSVQRNFRVYNVTVLASANDGISIQGSGESEVIGCRVYNQKHKGIHWGTNHDMARIMNNYVYGCGSAQYENPLDYQGSGGMFFCSYNHRIIITGNHIENCYKGIFGFNEQSSGECDSNTIIANNTFKNCALYGVILRDGIHAVLEANNFLGFGGTSIPIYVDDPNGQHLRNAVIANNTIGEWAAASLNSDNEYNPAIKIDSADGIVISGNVISIKKTTPAFPTVDASRCNVVVIGSNNVVITSNITEGNIDTSDSGNTGIIKANNIEAS